MIEATGITDDCGVLVQSEARGAVAECLSRDSVDILVRPQPETREKRCYPERSQQPFDTITVARQIISFGQTDAVKRDDE